MRENLTKKINGCLEAVLRQPLPAVSPDMRLREDFNMESLQLVELQVELETSFSIAFDPIEDDFFEIFQTVGSLYAGIEKKLESLKDDA